MYGSFLAPTPGLQAPPLDAAGGDNGLTTKPHSRVTLRHAARSSAGNLAATLGYFAGY